MRTPLLVGLALAVLFSFTACDDGGTAPTSGNTPVEVLTLVGEAFNDRDIDLLVRCLASDFTFHFDEDDVGGGPGDFIIPETWGKEEFLEAVGNVFAEAYSIDMAIDTSNVGTPGDDDVMYSANGVEVKLLVLVDATNGYLADGVCDFEFVDTGSGAPDNWVIRNWWDRTWPTGSGGRSVNRASIGFILSVFE